MAKYPNSDEEIVSVLKEFSMGRTPMANEIVTLRKVLRTFADTSDPGAPCYCEGGNHNPSHPTDHCRKIRALLREDAGDG